MLDATNDPEIRLIDAPPSGAPFIPDDIGLTGHCALVTGAGRGVGRGIARRLADRGATVIVNDYHQERAESVVDEIRGSAGQALALCCDVSNYPEVAAMVDAARTETGGIDILVNNAGNAGPATGNLFGQPPFWETGPDDWQPWLATNFFGVLNVSRACLPDMIEQRWGRVITVISDAGRVGEADLVVYGGAKAGAAGFSRGLAKAVGRYETTVNCVALGSMNTQSVAEVTREPDLLKKVLAGYTIRRLGEPEDAAQMIAFLASDAASWITGQTYPVNGGYSVTT